MFIIFTGNGKGKTTAALGQALRAIGDGKKVLVVQFIKGPWKSGEDSSHAMLSPYIKIVKKGMGFVGIGNDPHPFHVHLEAACDALEYARQEAYTEQWDIIILDEIWNALGLKLLSAEEISYSLIEISKHTEHMNLTGRGCPQQFIDQADLVTEMREIKHPFARGVAGKKGVEY